MRRDRMTQRKTDELIVRLGQVSRLTRALIREGNQIVGWLVEEGMLRDEPRSQKQRDRTAV
jgi:hypothetical protein